jgi:O-antigen ligase
MHHSIQRLLAVSACFGLPFVLAYGVLPLPNFINELAASLGLGLLLLVRARDPGDLRSGWPYWAVMATLAVLIAMTMAQAIGKPAPADPETYILAVVYLLLGALAFHLGWTVGSQDQARSDWMASICWVLVSCAALASAAGLVQYFQLPGHWALIPYLDTPGRAFGFIRQPNHQATFLAIGLHATAWLLSSSKIRGRTFAAIAALLVLGIVATGSRSGAVMLAISLPWMAWTMPKPQIRRQVLLVAIWLLAATAVLYWLHVEGIATFHAVAKAAQTATEGAGMRTRIWTETIRLIADKPFTGHGLGRYGPTMFASGAVVSIGSMMSNAHNLFLQIAFDFGVPAALLVAGTLMATIVVALQAHRQRDHAAALAMVGCILIHAMLEFPLWYTYFLQILLFMLGLAAAHVTARSGSPVLGASLQIATRRLAIHRASLAAAGLTIVVGCVWINNDFYRISPIFRAAAEGTVEERIEHAQTVSWFRKYVRFAKVMSQKVTPTSASAYAAEMQVLSCTMLEPLYQSSLVTALAMDGQLAAARRMLYLYLRLSKEMSAHLKAGLAEVSGPSFDALRRFIDTPVDERTPPDVLIPCLR